MKKETPVPIKHLPEAEHEAIHHYEDDQTVLARWIQWALLQGPRLWIAVLGAVLVVLVTWLAIGRISKGDPTAAEAWKEYILATSASDQQKVIDLYPDTKAARWVQLQLAEDYCLRAFKDLPASKDAAMPFLQSAVEGFSKVEEESTDDEFLSRSAKFGLARVYEARNDLEKARTKYEEVAKKWPDSVEGKQAAKLAKLLQEPDTISFYKELYAFKPTDMSLDPMGKGTFNLPGNHPPMDGPRIPAPGIPGITEPLIPGLPIDIGTPSSGANPVELNGIPDDVFQGKPADKKAAGPKPTTKTKIEELPEVFPDEKPKS